MDTCWYKLLEVAKKSEKLIGIIVEPELTNLNVDNNPLTLAIPNLQN